VATTAASFPAVASPVPGHQRTLAATTHRTQLRSRPRTGCAVACGISVFPVNLALRLHRPPISMTQQRRDRLDKVSSITLLGTGGVINKRYVAQGIQRISAQISDWGRGDRKAEMMRAINPKRPTSELAPQRVIRQRLARLRAMEHVLAKRDAMMCEASWYLSRTRKPCLPLQQARESGTGPRNREPPSSVAGVTWLVLAD